MGNLFQILRAPGRRVLERSYQAGRQHVKPVLFFVRLRTPAGRAEPIVRIKVQIYGYFPLSSMTSFDGVVVVNQKDVLSKDLVRGMLFNEGGGFFYPYTQEE